jgi:hypothetical protein
MPNLTTITGLLEKEIINPAGYSMGIKKAQKLISGLGSERTPIYCSIKFITIRFFAQLL